MLKKVKKSNYKKPVLRNLGNLKDVTTSGGSNAGEGLGRP